MPETALRITYRLDDADHGVGYIAVGPSIGPGILADFGMMVTAGQHSRRTFAATQSSEATHLAIAGESPADRLTEANLFSYANYLGGLAADSGYPCVLTQNLEEGVEPPSGVPTYQRLIHFEPTIQ
jgi:hypothetical protein